MVLRFLSMSMIFVSSPCKRSFASALAFRPTPPPRFDVFSELLVGSWKTTTVNLNDGVNDEQIVEEVMRSCGGAVQGLREPIHNQDPIYLNRANDGFVFFDNGCYTYGPVKRQGDDKFLQNLMVGNFKSRVVMFGNDGDDGDDDFSVIFQWKKSGALFDENPPRIQTELAPCALKVDFIETITCSKASPMQPWMLQRAKWQKEISESPVPSSSEKGPTSLNDSRIRCWSLTQSAADFYHWLWSSDDSTREEGTVVQAGSLCEATGEVTVIARHYDSSDDLKQVLFAEGVLQ
ncbi:unnamed protein product [Cylindrotheca closterium]|uniref:Uncharacterized protein n=1 Tax=Cylindrotheca closterium TaxID=2856 RepID=A0AAD2CEN5_9STRA|nr:unnamed protein product [Cylindrotheca closterium]